ncbi:MAG: hypothetical protein ACUVXG_06115, partial [Anaerolineae bacterium]
QPGAAPVEGYSNFLWVVLLSLPGFLGFDIVVASKVLGLLAILGTLYLSVRLLRHLTDDPLYGAGLAMLLASSFGIVFYGVSGLETLFLALLLAAGNCLFVRNGFRVSLPSTLCFVLVALTRPEGILYWPAVALLDWVRNRSLGRRHLAALALYGGLLGAFLLWRHSYYGEWLPNTFYAKPPHTMPVVRAFPDLHRFILYNGGIPFLLLAALPWWGGKGRDLVALLWSQVLVGLLFMLYSGGDWMASYRYLVPILPLYSVLAVQGLRQAVEAVAAHPAF